MKLQKFRPPMVKHSTLITMGILSGIPLFVFQLFATICWLSLLCRADSTVIRILYGCITVFSGWQTLEYLYGVISRLWQRHRRRKQGILEDPIAANHGETMAEVIEGIRQEVVEFVAYFSPNGEKVCEGTLNDPGSTTVERQYFEVLRNTPGCISVHNHPGEDISAFSIPDVTHAIKYNLSRSIIVTSEFCFVMDFPKGNEADPHSVRCFMNVFSISKVDFDQVAVNDKHSVNDEDRRIIENAKAKLSDPDCIASLMRSIITAEHFGFKFWMTPTDKENNSLLHGQ